LYAITHHRNPCLQTKKSQRVGGTKFGERKESVYYGTEVKIAISGLKKKM